MVRQLQRKSKTRRRTAASVPPRRAELLDPEHDQTETLSDAGDSEKRWRAVVSEGRMAERKRRNALKEGDFDVVLDGEDFSGEPRKVVSVCRHFADCKRSKNQYSRKREEGKWEE